MAAGETASMKFTPSSKEIDLSADYYQLSALTGEIHLCDSYPVNNLIRKIS